jgi:hypothetical protein
MTCLVCRHPKRREIDEQIERLVSRRAIGRHYGLSEACIRRHAHHGDRLKNATVQSLVKEMVSLGIPRKLAAQLIHIDHTTFRQTLEQDDAFRAEVLEAEAQLARRCLAAVVKAADGDWKAAAWLLERKWPQFFGKAEKRELESSRPKTLTVEYIKAIRVALGVEDANEPCLPSAGADRQAFISAGPGEQHAMDAVSTELDARRQQIGFGGEKQPNRLQHGNGSVGDQPRH